MSRPTHEKQFGAIRVHLTNPTPRKGLRILAGASKVLGQYLVDVLTAGGIERDVMVDGEVETRFVTISEMIVDPKERVKMSGYILGAIGRMDPDDAVELCESLILGQAKLARAKGPDGEGFAWVTVADSDEGREMIDNMFPSYFALIGAVRWAFEVYFLPILAAPDTNESSETGSGETPTPASP